MEKSCFGFVSSYLLDNCKHYVAMDDIEPDRTNITTGLHTWSLLFIIYLNDITSASTLFKLIMYAHNTTLFSTLSLRDVPN